MIEKRRWPWVAMQNWQDILFIHTPVSESTLRSLVPPPFEIDTYDGSGWVSIVLFEATGSRIRYMPPPFSYPRFYQMNVRTYVNFGNEPGVYFFAINTNSKVVNVGGQLVSMPFFNATITMQKSKGLFYFAASHKLINESDDMAFKAVYQPQAPSFKPEVGTLPFFLTERYCIWMTQGERIVKSPIFHSHWDLHDVNFSITENKGLPFSFSAKTLAHYSSFKQSVIYPFEMYGMISK